jgi:hypothetical protein
MVQVTQRPGRTSDGCPGGSAANLEGLETVTYEACSEGSNVDRSGGATRPRRTVRTWWAAVALAVLPLAGVLAPAGPLAGGRAAASAPHDLGSVEGLYAADLTARINAERAVRSSGVQPVPALHVDGGLQAAAQGWADHLASIGTVADPPLSGCGPAPSAATLCVLAGNSGVSGNGFWPGDGSDGMEAAYMNSAGHRQNMLNAGYDTVGVGVGCSGGQAYTVELFGFTYGSLGPAQGRQAAQNAVEGDPVPAGPSVAGLQTGAPVYCPGQTVGPNGAVTADGGQYPYPYPVPAVSGEPLPYLPPPNPYVGIAPSAGGTGYWEVRADGTVSAHGSAVNYGSMAGRALAAPIMHIVATPDGRGYWMVAGDGGIFSFGDAVFHGSMGGLPLNAPVVDMAPTSDGRGYWLVAADGGVFAFGDAVFRGSMGGLPLNAPVVGMAPDTSGNGYWLVGSDGGIFAIGDAEFKGSTGGLALNAPVVGMAADGTGHGYWLVGSDGGIFAFGDAPFRGSAGALTLAAPVVGMAPDVSAGGYWLLGSDGGVFAYGAPFAGAG